MTRFSFEFIQKTFERKIYAPLLLSAYKHSISRKVQRMRKKDIICVLFMNTDLATWKTEMLYLAMLKHPRFKPIIGVSTSPLVPTGKNILTAYLQYKGYPYVDFDDYMHNSIDRIAPDIIFYNKPYSEEYQYSLTHTRHLNSLFCYVYYSAHILREDWITNTALFDYCWQQYYENFVSAKELAPMMRNHGKNVEVTGFPIYDYIMLPKEKLKNHWKWNDGRKKIIYAPHHTIGESHASGIGYSTFLEYGEFMLDLAKKYEKDAVFCFKPHPSLYGKLIQKWGKQKTDEYYESWNNGKNTQMETGEYAGLFRYSDAMIHDCLAFTVEYHYSQNPVLFLVRDSKHDDNMTTFGKKAFDMHYKAYNKEDVDGFVKNVINNNDYMKDKRILFYNDDLLPPNGQTACQNIIDKILGV